MGIEKEESLISTGACVCKGWEGGGGGSGNVIWAFRQ